jgi:CubicO group peptidase (beta-lactamase class C family)
MLGSDSPQGTIPPNPQVDQIFAAWDKSDSPGLALAVSSAGKIIYKRGYGMADLDHQIAIDPATTVFHAASLAKQFTAMAVMLLVAQNRLKLDDAVVKYLGELENVECANRITIRKMLHHTSGIRDQWVLATLAGWRLSDDTIMQKDVLDLAKRMRTLNFDPGDDYSYSNTNYMLAGLIVALAARADLGLGQDHDLRDVFSIFVNKYIFQPLHMNSTKIAKTHGEIVNNRAYGYRGSYPNFEMRMPNYDLVGPTNLLTTVEDLIRWDHNFDSKVVGGASALLEMQTPEAPARNYGLGLFIGTYRGLSVFEHDGRDAGFRSHLIRFPQPKLAVALLCNVALPDSTPTYSLVRKVADIYLANSAAAEPHASLSPEGPPLPTAASSANPADYVGQYYSAEIDTTYSIVLLGSQLTLTRQKYGPVDLNPQLGTPDRFTIDNMSPPVLASVDVQFSRDKEGKIDGFRMTDRARENKRLARLPFVKVLRFINLP